MTSLSSAYLRLLIFLPAILIPACASSSPAFLMIYSAYKLNKQGDNIQPWHTPFSIWNQSVIPHPVLTVASWPAYRFLRRQVKWLEKAMAPHSSTLAWKIHGQRSLVGCSPWVAESRQDWVTELRGLHLDGCKRWGGVSNRKRSSSRLYIATLFI